MDPQVNPNPDQFHPNLSGLCHHPTNNDHYQCLTIAINYDRIQLMVIDHRNRTLDQEAIIIIIIIIVIIIQSLEMPHSSSSSSSSSSNPLEVMLSVQPQLLLHQIPTTTTIIIRRTQKENHIIHLKQLATQQNKIQSEENEYSNKRW